jgi:aspartyl aminopeptidase
MTASENDMRDTGKDDHRDSTPEAEQVSGEAVTLTGGSAYVIKAERAQLNQSAASTVYAQTVDLRESAAGLAESDLVRTDLSAVGLARAEQVVADQSLVLAARSNTASLNHSLAGVLIGNEVQAENTRTLFLFAGETNGSVQTTFDTRGALLAGIAAGVALAVTLILGGVGRRK